MAKPVKTYLFMYNYNKLILLDVFDTGNRINIFHNLFDDEKGWDRLKEDFECLFEGREFGEDMLGCPIPKFDEDMEVDENNYLAAFVKHYVVKGWKQFFSDVDRSWVSKDTQWYAFVRSDDTDKLLTIMNHYNMFNSYDNDVSHLDPNDYWKSTKRKREE